MADRSHLVRVIARPLHVYDLLGVQLTDGACVHHEACTQKDGHHRCHHLGRHHHGRPFLHWAPTNVKDAVHKGTGEEQDLSGYFSRY